MKMEEIFENYRKAIEEIDDKDEDDEIIEEECEDEVSDYVEGKCGKPALKTGKQKRIPGDSTNLAGEPIGGSFGGSAI